MRGQVITRMPRILQILGDSSFGGGTYLILEWCRFLVDKGCHVSVVSTDAPTIAELHKISGVEIVDSISIPRDPALTADWSAFWQLYRLLRLHPFDVVHTHTSVSGFIGRLAAWLSGVPIIMRTAHGWPVTEYSKWTEKLFYTTLEYLASLITTRMICVSNATASQGRRFKIADVRKMEVICNGIDPQPFIHLSTSRTFAWRRTFSISDDTIVIGNTARLAQQKGCVFLIQALPLLEEMLPERKFILMLAGDGPQKEQLRKLCLSLEVTDKVWFLGFRRDIPDLLSAIDIFVSPSLWEGLSISLLEAMAAAKPIVTTSILPNAELIEHEVTGLLVPPKSPEQIAQAIARFVQEPVLARRCGAAARQRVLEHYTIERMFEGMWNLYVSLLKEKQPEKVIA